MKMRAHRSIRLLGPFSGSLVLLCAIGCHSSASGSAKSVAKSETVTIDAATVVVGFSRGDIRQSQHVSTFEISRYPVTWQEFEACVASGVCEKPDNSGCAGDSAITFPGYASAPFNQRAPNAPAVCVGEEQAEAYCRAVNGRLPTLNEWLLAARGVSPTRFSWGDNAPTQCDQHPFAGQLVSHLHSGDPATMEGCPAIEDATPNEPDVTEGVSGRTAEGTEDQGPGIPLSKDYLNQRDFSRKQDPGKAAALPADVGRKTLGADEIAVGKHSSGASPTGVEDILITPGELLKGDKQAPFPACSQTDGHCVVFGADPGAIDAVQAFYKVPAGKNGTAARVVTGRAYGFRCVVPASEVSK